MEFFTNRIKVTSKWAASYSTTASSSAAAAGQANKKARTEDNTSMQVADKANFDGRM